MYKRTSRIATGALALAAVLTSTTWLSAEARAQGARPLPINLEGCIELQRSMMKIAANGSFGAAERALSAGLADGANREAQICAGLVLNSLAAMMYLNGRLAEGERLAVRSVTALEKVITKATSCCCTHFTPWLPPALSRAKRPAPGRR